VDLNTTQVFDQKLGKNRIGSHSLKQIWYLQIYKLASSSFDVSVMASKRIDVSRRIGCAATRVAFRQAKFVGEKKNLPVTYHNNSKAWI